MKLKHMFKPCSDWLLRSVPVLSPYGKKALKDVLQGAWPDSKMLKDEFDELDQVVLAIKREPDLFNGFASILTELRDITGTFANLERCQVLDEVEIFEIKILTLNLIRISQRYHHSSLSLNSIFFEDLQPLLKLLNPDDIITSSFYIYEAYSPDLKKLRQHKRKLEKEIVARVNSKEELRRQRAELIVTERQLEYQVRQNLSQDLQQWLSYLQLNVATIARLELFLARAVLAKRWPSCRPEVEIVHNSVTMVVEDAINPEIAEILEASGKEFCPVSIELQTGVTILTGANMGGKTVAMQTFAFNSQLARLGFYAFAKCLKMPAVDFICFVGVDSQNQHAGLSSFGAEIINLGHATDMIKRGIGLTFFDEFARSTNPCEGSRFVQALCEFLQKHRSLAMVATHYDGVKIQGAACYQVVGLKELPQKLVGPEPIDFAKMLDRLCANMDYRLEKVEGQYRVPHDALHIAKLLGIDREFLEILKKQYD